jgi:hypothetical protein
MKIPKQEQIMTTYLFDGVAHYVATRNTLGKYVLYKILNDDYQKMQTSASPLDFDKVIDKDRSN